MRHFLDKDMSRAVGNQIRRLRGDRTQEEMANILKVSRASWSNYEAGRRLPSHVIWKRIAEAVGVTVSDLYKDVISPDNADVARPFHKVELLASEIIDRLKTATDCANDVELGRMLRVSYKTISAWRSRNSIPWDICASLAVQFGISIDTLVLGRELASKPVPSHAIDGSLFAACWTAAARFETDTAAVQSLAIRTYNAAIGDDSIARKFELNELAAAIHYSERVDRAAN